MTDAVATIMHNLAMINLMRGELAAGRCMSLPGQAPFEIVRDDFVRLPAISHSDTEARIIAVWGKRKGCLDRLVASIVASGRTPIIVGAISEDMTRWLRKRRWTVSYEPDGLGTVDCWRPPTEVAI